MPKAYFLRDVPDDLWARFRYRAAYDGASARKALLALIQAYVDAPGGPPVRRTITVEIPADAIQAALSRPQVEKIRS